MIYTVKRKIRYGTMFLFLLLIILSGVSIFHIVRLQTDSRIILQDNYESLEYGHQMLSTVNGLSLNHGTDIERFEQALAGQEKNVTEPGEGTATAAIRDAFNKLKKGDVSSSVIYEIRNCLYKLLKLNMTAIESKNIRANVTAGKAVTYITMIAAVILIISLTFTFNFPSIVTNPINALTDGLAQISAKNYQHRIHVDRKDEFGQMAGAFNAMAERLEYFENSNLNQILFEKTRAESVINSLKDASIGIDKEAHILFANEQALNLLGLKAEDIVEKHVEEVRSKSDLFSFLLEEKNTMPFKIIVENRENYFVKEVIDIRGDTTGGRVIVVKNITSFKELDVARNNFIATISHELKTPLASSDFSLKLLKDDRIGHLTEEQLELVENLQRDNKRMLKIFSELLNLTQVEAGKMQLDIGPVSPYFIADGAIDSVTNAATDKNIVIEKIYQEHLGSVLADSEKTGWVLNNLLTNAIKYSKNNSIITVSIRQVNDEIHFSVRDQGSGIPSEYHSMVFDRYFKVPGLSVSGSGLGLTISKEFIEAQHGKIWVDSTPGVGSDFIFSLAKEMVTGPA